MKQPCFILLFSLVVCLQAPHAWAESSTHSVYRVTSYNLGALMEPPDAPVSFNRSNFDPLLITSTKSDILNSELEGTVTWVETSPHTANSRGIALSADFDATQKVSLHGAFGVTRNLWAPDSVDYENESSWEANLGVVYRLLDNLSFELHFGYMETGDLFTDRSSYTGVENIIMISNKVTMSF